MHVLNLQQDDEIGNLARAFNAMSVRIEASTVELGDRADTLADAVLAKTTELSTAKDIAEILSH